MAGLGLFITALHGVLPQFWKRGRIKAHALRTSFLYLGVDGIDEFRVAVADPNATFGHGSGAQMSIVGRRGANDFHGAAFYYMQNDALNANSWTNNRAGIKKPPLKDNRFGARLGGPIVRNRTFFYLNYDGRRFPQTTGITRLVPTDSLRQGILRFRDASGNVVSYPLGASSACGPQGNAPCDPRGLGISPTIKQMWSLLPAGNDPALGDGLNTIGFLSPVRDPINSGYYNGRIDHNLNDNWRIDVSERYFRQQQADPAQLSIIGGNVQSVRNLPVRENMDNIGLSGSFRPNLTAEFRFGRIRYRNAQDSTRPGQAATQLALPGTNTSAGYIALATTPLSTDLIDPPIDYTVTASRKKFWDNRIYQWNGDLNWIKGSHTVQFGAHIHYLPTRALSDDKTGAGGSVGSLITQLDADFGNITLPSSIEPQPCGPSVTTNCLPASQALQWDRLYATALGLVNGTTVILVRDKNLNPLPFGALQEVDTTGFWSPDFYLQDVWRLRPSLTLTVGLNYGWQTAPTEKQGRYTLQINADNGQLMTAESYLKARLQAAQQGQIYNPNFGFVPVNQAHHPIYNTDWKSLSPRASLAWNPSATSGLLGKVLGNRKTVLRGGFSILYDKIDTIGAVYIQSLAAGFAQQISANAPACNTTGPGGAGCNPGSSNQAASVFRVGQDGSIPLPVVPQISVPYVPSWCRTGSASCLFPEGFSLVVDPSIRPGKDYVTSLSLQRELSGDLLLEAAYVGRYARRLPVHVNLEQVPYMQVDPGSGQTFAQAFDNVATALRSGANVIPQPWFENQVPGGTLALAAAARSNFINGNVNSVFTTLDTRRMAAGLQPFNNYMAQATAMRTDLGFSNYNGLLVTLRKRLSRGFIFDLNQTFARSLDSGDNQLQNGATIMPNSFHLGTTYGPSTFDMTHIFNGRWYYELPFHASNRLVNKFIGGWFLSGIFTAHSGSPLLLVEGTQAWGGSLTLTASSGAVPTVSPSSFGGGVHGGITGAGGVATNGNAASGGTGLNLFANPQAAFAGFRPILIGSDGREGRANPLRGLGFWNLDSSLGKRVAITDRLSAQLAADFFNIFNNVNFLDPTLSLTSPQSFGVITSQLVPANRSYGSRATQLSLRLEF